MTSAITHVFPDKQGKWKATTQSREFLKSIKRYYSNAYTDGEKQDAINLFLGYFKPQEGKPALWELDSDYYLHVTGVRDGVILDKSPSDDAQVLSVKASLEPIPACKEDFSRIKLTSFNKLIEKTCSLIKNVRLCSEPGQRPTGSGATSGVAPDAIEIQLKSPNWLFGQRKDEQTGSTPKAGVGKKTYGATHDDGTEYDSSDLSWLFPADTFNEEDIYQSYLSMSSVDEANGWYGGTLLGDLDENSEIYKHYAQFCEGPSLEPFENDEEREEHYEEVVQSSLIENVDDAAVEAEMTAILKEYDQVGVDLGIAAMCRPSARDPSQLTRWLIGEDKFVKL